MLDIFHLRKRMDVGQPVLGIWNTLGSFLVTEILARAGLDFQIIDLEHGVFSLKDVHRHVAASESVGDCSPIVRIPVPESWMALQALDQGAHGLVVPHVEDRSDAEQIATCSKYNPEGERGFSPFTKAGGFTNEGGSSYPETANKKLVNVVIIESGEGLRNLDKIVEVSGIDVVYFGAYDLSQVLGVPGDTKHPRVVKAIRRGAEIAIKYGKYAGGFVPQTEDDVKWNLDIGMNFITYSVDSAMVFSHIQTVVNSFIDQTGRSGTDSNS